MIINSSDIFQISENSRVEFDGGSYVRLEWDDVIQTEADDMSVRLRTRKESGTLVSLVSSADNSQKLVLHIQHGQLVLTLAIRSTTQVRCCFQICALHVIFCAAI